MNEKRVLVLDDEQALRDIIADILEDLGYVVTHTESGYDALEMLKTTNFDYILSDVKMPLLSGPEFIKQARELSTNTNCQYLLITAYEASHFGEDIAKLIDGYIVKPFSEESIMKALAMCTGLKYE